MRPFALVSLLLLTACPLATNTASETQDSNTLEAAPPPKPIPLPANPNAVHPAQNPNAVHTNPNAPRTEEALDLPAYRKV